jgi:CDP-paratose 2-epimerase
MKVIITGGAGFIGSNAAARHLDRHDEVIVIDNLSRRGSEANLAWLRARGGALRFLQLDVRDPAAITRAFREHAGAERVLHLAGQVAVTTSVDDPRADFEVNAAGTFNVLEAMRAARSQAVFIYSSTNKVYGELPGIRTVLRDGRYVFDGQDGVSEEQPLDFHSPYGCSKGAADQYVRDYARIYGLRTVVLRQSCIYGYRQFGIEDQGWIGWFAIAARLGLPLRIYGDGRQVRDVLFIDDLLDAFDAVAADGVAQGAIFNIGGGPANAVSLRDVLSHLGTLTGREVPLAFGPWRPGDQKVYVSDIGRAHRDLGWAPAVTWRQGVERLYHWIDENVALFA